MKVEDLRKVIKQKCGILPGIQKLAYAGKNFEDSNRTLEQCASPPSPSPSPPLAL
jgi:hypothetical protein